ncbi:MAG: glycosyltransferase family 4 protein [Candidatus Diapherotrites archaeon]
MKKVCMIGTPYLGVPPRKGGAIEYLSFELAKVLSEKGYCITYYSVLTERNEKIQLKNLRVVRFPARRINGFIFNLFVFFSALTRDFDLVYFSGCSVLPAAFLLAKVKRLPLLYHEFNHNPWVRGKSFLFDWLAKKSIESADLVITPSDFIKNKITGKISSARKKVVAIHHSLDLKEFPVRIPKKEKKIVFVGRLLEHKGLHYLIESMKEFNAKNPEWVLVVIGPKGEFNKEHRDYFLRIKKMIKDYSLKGKVLFKGQISRSELIREVSTSSVLVLPSSNEAFGLVLIEAMACWTPCIAFDAGATREIIENNRNGFVVKQGDQKELTMRMHELIEDENKRTAFCLNSRKTAEEKFALERQVSKFVWYFNKLN